MRNGSVLPVHYSSTSEKRSKMMLYLRFDDHYFEIRGTARFSESRSSSGRPVRSSFSTFCGLSGCCLIITESMSGISPCSPDFAAPSSRASPCSSDFAAPSSRASPCSSDFAASSYDGSCRAPDFAASPFGFFRPMRQASSFTLDGLGAAHSIRQRCLQCLPLYPTISPQRLYPYI